METGLYRHYRGGLYVVTDIGFHTETEEELVSYFDVTDPRKVWFRPKGMFTDSVINSDGRQVPRFEFLQRIVFHKRDWSSLLAT